MERTPSNEVITSTNSGVHPQPSSFTYDDTPVNSSHESRVDSAERDDDDDNEGIEDIDDNEEDPSGDVRRETVVSPHRDSIYRSFQSQHQSQHHSHYSTSSEVPSNYPEHMDYRKSFADFLNEDRPSHFSRPSSYYPGRMINDDSDDDLIGDVANGDDGMGLNTIISDDGMGRYSHDSAQAETLAKIGDVLYLSVTLFECCHYISVFTGNYSQLYEELTKSLEKLKEYVCEK